MKVSNTQIMSLKNVSGSDQTKKWQNLENKFSIIGRIGIMYRKAFWKLSGIPKITKNSDIFCQIQPGFTSLLVSESMTFKKGSLEHWEK